MEKVAIKGRGGNDVQHKNWKGKILRIWKKQYTLFLISFDVVFELLVLVSLYFGRFDLFSRDPTFTTNRIFL